MITSADPTLSLSLEETVALARRERRTLLLEHETHPILQLFGIRRPRERFVAFDEDDWSAANDACERIPGTRVVIKVVATDILHKTEAGGVRFVHKQPVAIVETIREMRELAADHDVRGFLVSEYLDHDLGPGSELLLSIRWSADFGPIVSFAAGGVSTEILARNVKRGREIAIFSPGLTRADRIKIILARKAVTRLVTGIRGQKGKMPLQALSNFLYQCCSVAGTIVPDPIMEIEINPLVPSISGPIALDAVVRLGAKPAAASPERPIAKIGKLLRPDSVAVAGVSKSMNPGRVIVRNLLAQGFDTQRITIVKPGEESIDGCRCVGSVAEIPGRADLLILSLPAEQSVEAVEQAISGRKAESIVIIPGGFGEHEGSEGLDARIRSAIATSRGSSWHGPVVNGPNCLGFRSGPGRVDTIFLPRHKLEPTGVHGALPAVPAWSWGREPGLPLPAAADRSHGDPAPGHAHAAAPLAIISQSGAFCVSTANKLAGIEPRYLISIGNQIDLTAGDYMSYLENDESIAVFAFYIEGFQPLDGRRWAEAASRAVRGGRPVILYRAGRTPAGRRATATHTAAIAGDAVVTRELASGAGVVVAETLDDFQDLIRLFTLLGDREIGDRRLAAMSNAGYESVAFADHLGRFELATLGRATKQHIAKTLRASRLERIVTVDNPIDVNPMLGDAAFAEVARLLLDDEGADAGVIGCVPLTGALQTLPAGPGHSENLRSATSVVSRLVTLWNETEKPWVAVVDAGPLYDPMARMLEEGGIPTFRTADRALRLFGVWCEWSLRWR